MGAAQPSQEASDGALQREPIREDTPAQRPPRAI